MKDKKKCVVTGNPVRCEILSADKETARQELGLSDKPFVLVFGGSLGAQKINETMIGVLKKLFYLFSIINLVVFSGLFFYLLFGELVFMIPLSYQPPNPLRLIRYAHYG